MSMKINKLEIENVKRIKAVKVEPILSLYGTSGAGGTLADIILENVSGNGKVSLVLLLR